MDFYVEHFNLKTWFDTGQIIYDNDTFSGKPHPDIYLKAAEKIGVQTQDCVVVEDAVSGIQSAYRAGVRKNYRHCTKRKPGFF